MDQNNGYRRPPHYQYQQQPPQYQQPYRQPQGYYQQPQVVVVQQPAQERPGAGLAATSMIFALIITFLGWLVCAIPISAGIIAGIAMIVIALLCIIFSIVSLARGSRGTGMAVVGIIFSVIGIITTAIILVMLYAAQSEINEGGAFLRYGSMFLGEGDSNSWSFFDFIRIAEKYS